MSIAKDGYIYVFGEVINKSMPFILIPYLTRNLGEYGYGLLSYYQSIITLFIVLVGISGDGAYAKYYYRYGRRSAYKVVFASAIYSLLISCFFIAYYFFYDNFLYVYIVIIALFQSLININLSKYQCKKEPLSYLKLQCGFTFTAIILTMVLFDLLSASIENRIFAVLIAGLIMVLCVFRIKIPNLNVKQIKTYLLYVIAFGFPLIFHHISFLIKGQLDRIYLINVYPAETISSYAIAYQLSTIVFVLIIALNKAIVPYFYESIKNGTLTSNKLLKYFYISFLFPFILGVIAYYVPNELYELYVGYEFSGFRVLITILVISMSMTLPYLILVNYFYYSGLNNIIAICALVSAMIYVIMILNLASLDIIMVAISLMSSNLIMIFLLLCFFMKNKK